MTHTEQIYGGFMGGDPRRFQPDRECCTPAEIAAWEQACREWDAGAGTDRGPGCDTFGDGASRLGTGFGVGVTTIDDCRCDEPPPECIHGVPGAIECAACEAMWSAIRG